MKKILTIGGVMRDIFLENTQAQTMYLNTDEVKQSFIILQEGRKIDVKELSYHVGGGAANSAVSFALLGHPVESFFKIGTDAEGDFICTQLQKKGVGIDSVMRDKHGHTGTSIIIPCPSGDRAVLVYRGANLTLTQQEIPLSKIAACEQLYISSLSSQASQVLPFIIEEAQKHSIPIAINPGTSQLTVDVHSLEQALAHINIFILNTYEATLFMNTLVQATAEPTSTAQQGTGLEKQITRHCQTVTKRKTGTQHILHQQTIQKSYQSTHHTKLPELLRQPMSMHTTCFTLRQFFIEIIHRGPTIIVVTNGAEGVYATDGSYIYFHPSIPSKTVSTLGAGDAFGSTFVSHITRGKSITDALKAGIVNASSVLSSIGTQTGLLTLSQLNQRIALLDSSLLQLFSL